MSRRPTEVASTSSGMHDSLRDMFAQNLASVFREMLSSQEEPVEAPVVVPSPRRTRRPRSTPQRLRYGRGLDVSIEVPGRDGPVMLTGRAADVYRRFRPSLIGLPESIPIREKIHVWGRDWIVKDSGLGDFLGLFACEDIVVRGGG